MATYTPNYNLKKPAAADLVAVGDLNGNMDTLDTNLHRIEGAMVTLRDAQNITGEKTFNPTALRVKFSHNGVGTGLIANLQTKNLGDTAWGDYVSVKDASNVNVIQHRLDMSPNGVADMTYIKSPNNTQRLLLHLFSGDNDAYIKSLTPQTPSLNDTTVPTINYINNPAKATYLVHRAGTEILTGDKFFQKTVNIQSPSVIKSPTQSEVKYLPQLAWLDKNGAELIRLIPTVSTSGVPHLYLVRYKGDGTSLTTDLGA